MNRPFILSPAGSYDALTAAISGGADEIYFGKKDFNARFGAKNFTDEEFADAIKLCRIMNVKSNITVNTLVTDRETNDVLDLVYDAACLGADAFIVQDTGLAKRIHSEMPQVILHASTQCACHSLEGAIKLSEYGFSRIVLARELPLSEIKSITSQGIETEIFMHGALCVCHSGMCLMSSVIGGRSGNRGMCAQPCRLPYSLSTDTKKNMYPLSLRDLSLAKDIEKLADSGVTSLKIEGRRKAPEYVYGVTKIYRELIDESRNAGTDEISLLEALFSRGGFTDGYFTGEYTKNNSSMYGVRSDGDKEKTAETQGSDIPLKKRSIKMECRASEGEKPVITAICGKTMVSAEGDFICESAKSLPMTESELADGLKKLGSTPFFARDEDISAVICGKLFMPKSRINSLRRTVTDKLFDELTRQVQITRNAAKQAVSRRSTEICKPEISLVFRSPENAAELCKMHGAAYAFFPLECFDSAGDNGFDCIKSCGVRFGVQLPRVIFTSEYDMAFEALCRAKKFGAEYALISNIGQIEMAKKACLKLFGGIGLNVFNSASARLLHDEGFCAVTLSPELNPAQMRDIERAENVKAAMVVKGRLPLMVLESCIIRANGVCRHNNCNQCGVLHDRKGYDFPVGGQKRFTPKGYPCRNIVYNSVELDLTGKKDELSKACADIYTVLL